MTDTPAPVDISPDRIEIIARGCDSMGWDSAAADVRALRSALTARDELLRDLGAAMQDFAADPDRPAHVFHYWLDRISAILAKGETK
jgi:hypothetical protein